MATIEGEIDHFVRNVRRLIGEQEEGEWTDVEIVDAGNQLADRIFMDILLPADTGYGEYYADITFVADQETYATPYGLLRFNWASELDDDNEHVGTERNIFRSERGLVAGVWLTEREIGISPIPTAADTDARRLYYVRKPVPMHKAEAQGTTTATAITLGKSAHLGQILTQDNSYLGCRVQVLNAATNEGEIATVTAYAGDTHIATVAWTNTPTTVTTYEVMPDLPPEAYDLWWTMTADQCLSDHDAGSGTRLSKLARDIGSARRALLHVVNTRMRRGRPPWWEDDLVII